MAPWGLGRGTMVEWEMELFDEGFGLLILGYMEICWR